MTTAGGRIEAPRHTGRLLLDRTFGPFIAGKLLASLGVWMQNIAAAILVYELTRSVALVGAVSIAQFAPQLIITPWSGARADSGDRRRQVVLGRLIAAVGPGGLALVMALVRLGGVPGTTAVIVAALVAGIGHSLGGPAMHALVPVLVEPDELPTAVALNSFPHTVARAGGPALGALLGASLGAGIVFAVAATAHLVFAAVLATIPIRPAVRPVVADRSVRAGLRYVRSERRMAGLLLGVAVVGIAADPAITLTPVIADAFGGDSGMAGLLAGAFGLGAGAAFLLLSGLRRRLGLARLGTGGLSLMSASLLALAASPSLPFATAALATGGAGMTIALTAETTLLQLYAAEEFRGRIMALWSLAFLGSRPLAAGVNGVLADVLSYEVALVALAATVALGAFLIRPSRTGGALA